VSHLDTAFKIGAAQAQHDFQAELDKVAQGDMRPPIPTPDIRPGQPQPGPAPRPMPAPTPKLPIPNPGLGPRQPGRPVL
jgi:hypothetical protein